MKSGNTSLLELVNTVRRNKGRAEFTSIEGDPHLRSELGFDSLDLAELTVRIEERFGVDVFADGILHRWSELVQRVEAGSRNRD